MTFGVQDFHDLVRLLDQRPKWRAELRRLVLTDDLLGLPALVAELAEAQRATQAEVGELRKAVRELADAQRRTEEELRQVVEAQGRTDVRVDDLTRVQNEMLDHLGALRGSELERQYREHAGACFDDVVRRPRLLSRQQLADLLGRLRPALAAVAGERITPEVEALAEARGVWRVLDGRVMGPDRRED